MKSYKIARIITRLNVGGPAQHVTLLTKTLNEGFWKTHLITGNVEPHEKDMSYFVKGHGVDYEVISHLKNSINIYKDLLSLAQIFRSLRKFRPVIVHTHLLKAGILGRVAAILARIPIRIHTYHGHIHGSIAAYEKLKLRYRLIVLIERVLARFTDTLIVLTEYHRNEIIRLKIAPSRKIAVIPLGLDLDNFFHSDAHRGELRKELGLDNVPLVGLISRLEPIKNVLLLLQASELLFKEIPDTRIIIVGDGRMKPDLEKWVIKNSTKPDHIYFLGHRSDIFRIVADLDVVVLTSRNEGMPVSLIEAMAAGCAIVATKVGGIPYVITSEKMGILIDDNNFKALAESLITLLRSPQRMIEMGKYCKEIARNQYAYQRLSRDIQNLYKHLLKQKFMKNF